MTYTFEENIFSDLHKDARGRRPGDGHEFYQPYTTDARKQEIWDSMIEEFNDEQKEEEMRHTAALESFEARIAATRALGASTDVDAIKWILESEELTAYDYMYGVDYVAYHFGLAYSNPLKELFTKAMADVSQPNYI